MRSRLVVVDKAEYFEFKARAAEHAAAVAKAELAMVVARVAERDAAEAVREVVRRLGAVHQFEAPCDISAVDDVTCTIRVEERSLC